jgi:hypothetical protein
VKVTATSQETSRAKARTQKMLPAYSPTPERAKPMGTKPMTVTRVPLNMGAAVTVQAWAAARSRSQPSSIFTSIISMAMMASSTRRPRAMMRAPRVTRSRLMPRMPMRRKVSPRVKGMAMPTTSPARHPRARKLTSITTATATMNLIWKRFTARAMASAWLVMRVKRKPSGSSSPRVCSKAARRSPRIRPFSPRPITTPSRTDSVPLVRIR